MAKPPRVQTPRFAEQARVLLKGSEKAAAENAVHVKATPDMAKITVSVIVKRKEPLKINKRAGRANGPVRVSREEYEKHHTADPAALELVSAFAKEFNLKVEDDPTAAIRRTVQLTGTAADIKRAFGVELNQKNIDGVEYRLREGGIQLPEALIGSVLAVLGLDNRPQAKPHFRVPMACHGQRCGADDRHHRTRRRVPTGRPDGLLPDAEPGGALGDRGQRGQGQERAIDVIERGRRGDAGH
jgi:kumamolisin